MEESKVKTAAEHIRCPESAIELLADIDVFKALRMPQEALNIIDLYVQSHITKLEARNKELEEALCSIKQMKGKCLGVREVGKESIKIAEQALKQV